MYGRMKAWGVTGLRWDWGGGVPVANELCDLEGVAGDGCGDDAQHAQHGSYTIQTPSHLHSCTARQLTGRHSRSSLAAAAVAVVAAAANPATA